MQRDAERCFENWNITSEVKDERNTTQHEISNNFWKHKCAPVCRIHGSFGCNQHLAHFILYSVMQSGELETRTENQKQISKNTTQHTISNNFWKHKCAPVCRIHVGFGCNEQLAHFNSVNVTIRDSDMQSGASSPGTKNQKRISKTQYNTKFITNFKQKHCGRRVQSYSSRLFTQFARVIR